MTDKIHFTFHDDHAELVQLRARVKELEGALNKTIYELKRSGAPGDWLITHIEQALKGQANGQT